MGKRAHKSASSWSLQCGAGRESEKRGTENPSTNWDKAMKEGTGSCLPLMGGSSVLSASEKASFSTALEEML